MAIEGDTFKWPKDYKLAPSTTKCSVHQIKPGMNTYILDYTLSKVCRWNSGYNFREMGILMGMFDYIAVESDVFDEFNIKPSPRDNPVNQTKSFACVMNTYLIKDRDLYLVVREYKQTDKVRHKFGNFISYERELISEYLEKIEYHGVFRMSTKPIGGTYGELFVKFTDGKLVDVMEQYAYPDFGEGW